MKFKITQKALLKYSKSICNKNSLKGRKLVCEGGFEEQLVYIIPGGSGSILVFRIFKPLLKTTMIFDISEIIKEH